MSRLPALLPLLAAVLLAPAPAEAGPRTPIALESALYLEQPGVSRREPLHSDAVEALIVAGKFRWPEAGQVVEKADGTRIAWQAIEANEQGVLQAAGMRGGYVAWSVYSDERRIALLEASGHSAVHHDGSWRMGDHYSFGWLSIPVKLRKGENRFLFRVGRRGRLKAELLPTDGGVFLDARDATLPQLPAGGTPGLPEQGNVQFAAVTVINATEEQVYYELESQLGGGELIWSRGTPLAPLSAGKSFVAFAETAGKAGETLPLRVTLRRSGQEKPAEATLSFDIEVVAPEAARRVTFASAVDGSVQYYGLQPAWPDSTVKGRPGLILSTHGAGVQGLGQAQAYAPKAWAHVVAPTNRRIFGFDWEDWGRLDAMEALDHARRSLGTDPRKQYVTGHSMGGHGAWHLGVTFPDQWAVVGPSAGWISFRSYAGSEAVAHAHPAAELLDRAWRPSDTLALVSNLDDLGVYILHGADDDNVPATEARKMKEVLEGRKHPDLHYHEEPGKKHWWNLHPEPGADCVDWLPMMDLMARRSVPDLPRELDFTTAHPAVSSRSHWAEIVAAEKAFVPARIRLRRDPSKRVFAGTTENVFRLALELAALRGEGEVTVELDGKSFSTSTQGEERLLLERRGGDWVAVSEFPAGEKSPERAGPFREAFRNGAVLVYGTQGSRDENAWAMGRARLDSESFRYRGNASFPVIPDADYDERIFAGRNVILYGGRHVNGLWDRLLGDSPVVVERDQVRIGKQRLEAGDLAVLLVRPHPTDSAVSIGVVAGTGLPGARLTDRIPYFVSGIAYPDLTVLDSTSLSKGPDGLRAAGFFGHDWSIEAGEIAVRP